MVDPTRLLPGVIKDGESSYFPVFVASLRVDSVIGFDLYFRPGPDQPLVLYAERHIPFTEDKRARLANGHVSVLYIDTLQEDHYQRYLERNLPQILADPTIPASDKTDILYASAQGTVKEILDNPENPVAFRRSKEIVTETVQFIFSEHEGFHDFVRATSYDYFTYTHCVNVCVFGLALAIRAGYSNPEFLHDFGNGLLLHDVGKCRIDPRILNAPGKLTNEQWIKLKQHPVYGHEIVAKTGQAGPVTLDVIRHHHEKLDGSGYPDRLHGKELPPWIRMACIVDIFDAMTTHRPYQRATSTFDTLKLMRFELGATIDLDLFRLFVELLGQPQHVAH